MPTAIELIAQGYIELNDRQAVESLKKHREDLAAHLRENKDGWFDYSASISKSRMTSRLSKLGWLNQIPQVRHESS